MFHLLGLICLSIWRVVGGFADSGVVKSAMKGDLVTLDSGVAQLEQEHALRWLFGHNNTRIAQINKEAGIFSTSDGDAVGFTNRLTLDDQTGSLTIMNTTTADSGLYRSIINGQIKTTYTFNVYALLPVPDITSKPLNSSSQYSCSVVCSVVNVSGASLSWYKGNSLLSSISASDLRNSVSLDLKSLDESYSCVVNISNTNQTRRLSNTELCQPCPEQTATNPSNPYLNHTSPTPPPLQISHIIMISAGAVSVSLLTLAIVGIIWICRNPTTTDRKETVRKQTRDDRNDDEITYAAPTFHKKHAHKSEDEVVYAGIVTKR